MPPTLDSQHHGQHHGSRPVRAVVPGLALAALLALLLAGCGSEAAATSTPATATPTATVPPPVSYVAIGASDAVGIGASDRNKTAYVPLIIARLPKGSSALNLGIDGATIEDALTRMLPQAVEAHPTLVTVWMMGNDMRACTSLDTYKTKLETLLGTLETQTQAQVFVANMPDMSLLPSAYNTPTPCLAGKTPEQIRAMTQQWNAAVAPIVAKHHAVLVDLYNSAASSFDKDPAQYIASDGLHPSDAGYRIIADVFWAQITAHHAVPGA